MTTRRVTILGSTGSIGQNTLDLIRRSPPGTFKVVALTANNNADLLALQAREFEAEYVALASSENAPALKERLTGTPTEIGIGKEALKDAGSRPADFVMSAIIGAAGLEPTLAAIQQGTHIGLANKESLVCAGDLVMQAVDKYGAKLLPVDSEHNAIFQVLETDRPKGVRRLILTASGGPFLNRPIADLSCVKPQDALQHPIWEMGAKITVDSASMMNKGLELIEAGFLFSRPSAEIDVIIHPQSIVHSMVEYIDGSVLSQMGSPDMRTPIAYALAWPDRMEAPVERLDLTKFSGLTFYKPDLNRFPALRIAREAMEAGGQAPNILNASNEIAVAAFLNEAIGFSQIPEICERVLHDLASKSDSGHELRAVLETDKLARRTATDIINSLR